MRLAQRLKRSLAAEGVARDEVEELRHRLAVVSPDEVRVRVGLHRQGAQPEWVNNRQLK